MPHTFRTDSSPSPGEAEKSHSFQLNTTMTRTMKRVVLFVLLAIGMYGADTAGAHKDYEVCVGNSEQRLEVASQQHNLGDPIYYEAATGFEDDKAATDTTAKPTSLSEQQTDEKLNSADNAVSSAAEADPRVERVRVFFQKHNAPAAKYAKLFIEIADEYKLDWYLLPSIAFVESSGGKVCPHNNIFGWDSGKVKFPTVEDGIRFVGRALTKGPYAGKNSRQKLRVYNVYPHYQTTIAKVMRWVQTTPLP